ncbi:MAG: virulence RhuM family protein [Bacteroidales bacterium]|nr:virulence RhuM family protein [Bacteroidales bacterium]
MDNRLAKNHSEFLIYEGKDGKTTVYVRFNEQDVWLTQDQLALLFGIERPGITQHIKNIFAEEELIENSVSKKFLRTAADGKNYATKHYNLDMIISLGYRVNSKVATQFRIWATEKLHSYIQKGFTINIDRLKNPDNPFDYFEELEQIIQDIRTSERRFYLKITDIYATSIDYDKNAETTKNFFATVQNKMHWAISGQTAAEIIYTRANANKDNMGLTSWQGQRIRKPDVVIAKNYLNKDELQALNDLVEQYLLFAQTQARRRIAMTMQDWINKLHGFLTLNERTILMDAGKISHELAIQHAEKEYDIFRIKQAQIPYNTDFEDFIENID